MTGTVFRRGTTHRTPARAARYTRLSKLIGHSVHSDLDVATCVAQGVEPILIDHLTREGLTRKELEFVIPARTLAHRIARKESLSRDESERGVRIANLLVLAEQVLGGAQAATDWLRHPLVRFGGATPLETARTEQGARLVENLLTQIDEGYFA
ncbi:antitoxin Xre/MbcA/ParS toxin-binding domain-containing protein [Paludibacterium paludis]|uniref:Uncharacterized protein n=1 Tax=Paludibacterium paludis TaxID=1225769 RepID=A0A918P5V6_9NEIS|nr:antitoxin Xre/MbcA/ParS toxin-binding domain-containing protein [Paludibacterium paludis]GGY23336.1 hypothetical protein GCM10011289_28910 [Paludibacterium paludis]